MIYAIGDIHGMYTKLTRLYRMITMDIASHGITDATIIFLGDYVDRGPQSDKVLDFLMSLKDTDSLTHIFLKGNHEDMMVDNYYRDGHITMWLTNGGRETLDAFGIDWPDNFYNNSDLKDYIIWCKKLPTMHIIGPYAFVHGGYDCKFPPHEQRNEVLMWKRVTPYMEGREYNNCDFIIVHGHTPFKEAQVHTNEINVDTFACYDGPLTAVRLPNDLTDQALALSDTVTTESINAALSAEIKFLTAQ